MSPAKGFDSFMVQIGICKDRKVRRLAPAERWCIVAVLSLAADSPVRGALLLAERDPIGVQDVADEAGVTRKIAQAALVKLERLGFLERDDVLGCLVVANWDEHQAVPRHDPTGAARQARRRQRMRDDAASLSRDRHVTDHVTERDCHGGEVEEEGEVTEREGAHAPATELAATVDAVLAVLSQSDRLHIDQVGVENAIAAWPNGDPVQAARVVITWVSDPAFNGTNGARLLTTALSKQQQDQQPRPGRGPRGRRSAQGEHPADRRDREIVDLAARIARGEAA